MLSSFSYLVYLEYLTRSTTAITVGLVHIAKKHLAFGSTAHVDKVINLESITAGYIFARQTCTCTYIFAAGYSTDMAGHVHGVQHSQAVGGTASHASQSSPQHHIITYDTVMNSFALVKGYVAYARLLHSYLVTFSSGSPFLSNVMLVYSFGI
jgi:hypothetical protein